MRLRALLGLAVFAAIATSSLAQNWSDETVNIVFVTRADLSRSSGKDLPIINATTQASAQEELQADPDLQSYLEGRNVALPNVVAIVTAANGEKIVYVK